MSTIGTFVRIILITLAVGYTYQMSTDTYPLIKRKIKRFVREKTRRNVVP